LLRYPVNHDGGGDGNTTNNESINATIDFGQNQSQQEGGITTTTTTTTDVDEQQQITDYEEEEAPEDIVLVGIPVPVPIMICLQPCPLVFYRGDSCADPNAFRFLWLSLPHRVPPLDLIRQRQLTNGILNGRRVAEEEAGTVEGAGCVLASISSLYLSGGNDSPIQAWSFSTWVGKRLLCIFS